MLKCFSILVSTLKIECLLLFNKNIIIWVLQDYLLYFIKKYIKNNNFYMIKIKNIIFQNEYYNCRKYNKNKLI